MERLAAVFELLAEGGHAAYVEEVSGVNAQEETLEEARDNLREALESVLESRRELAEEQQVGRTITRENIQLVAA